MTAFGGAENASELSNKKGMLARRRRGGFIVFFHNGMAPSGQQDVLSWVNTA
jgi:hypothetical protein